MGVGVRLKEILKHRNMTIKELASKTQIPVNTLYSITKRDSYRINLEIAEKISRALNVPQLALFSDSFSKTTEGWESLGEFIETMAKNEDMSIRKLAIKSDISYNTLYSFVKNKRNKMDFQTLAKIANSLGCELSVSLRPKDEWTL